jgi:prophage DNA circulation protein
MYADDARKAYDQYLKGSKEMVQALSIDLSPAAISSLSEAMDRVMMDGNALKQRITALQRALDNMANGVSPIST